MAGKILACLHLLVFFLAFDACWTVSSQTLNPGKEGENQAGVVPLLVGNTTILSPNGTFELGFFTVDGGSSRYLGIWYASIPIRTYVWVANRRSPVRTASPVAFLTSSGRLAVGESFGSVVWVTENVVHADFVQLLDTGNFVLFAGSSGAPVWQSFDFPSDTWLPEMSITRSMAITSWRSTMDPSPGAFSLRLRQPEFGEFELVFNHSIPYWSTGNWTGNRFAGVPEMTVPYIYSFRFSNPFTPEATFDYSQSPTVESGLQPLLSRFAVDPSGQVMQYTWSPQAASWNMFWSRPENPCRVYGRCGSLGVCVGGGLNPCSCPPGLRPVDPVKWGFGDFFGGCSNGAICHISDEGSTFYEMGPVEVDASVTTVYSGVSRSFCDDSCRENCSCFGLIYNSKSRVCTNLYGSAYNLRNSTTSPVLYLKILPGNSYSTKRARRKWKVGIIVGILCAIAVNLIIAVGLGLTMLYRRRLRPRHGKQDGGQGSGQIAVTNLQVFTYKELSAATRGFSEKVGHGGFGAVFRGTLPESTPVAVKRLDRPDGGDREFRAEVRTIGSVQHVNLVRLRGFCSEDPHRLLVYDYMPNGSLSAYLGRGRTLPALSWPARFRVALGTARGIAYLHEECRDCIIHCDIKPENILLDADFTPKVSDFGLAKLVGRDLSRVLATTRGTWGYVAPEWLSGVAITAKADVYSYGMTLLEIIGGRRNVEVPAVETDAKEGQERWFFAPWAAKRIVEGDISAVVEEGVEGYNEIEAERAGRVAVWCIQDEEAARPAMGMVVKMLEGTVDLAPPPLPQMLQALDDGESFRREVMGSGEGSSAGEILVEAGRPGEARGSSRSQYGSSKK